MIVKRHWGGRQRDEEQGGDRRQRGEGQSKRRERKQAGGAGMWPGQRHVTERIGK